MQITVFGASGKVGSLVVEEALKRGFTVVAFVHSHNLFSPNGNLIIQKGDIYNAADVAKAVRGSDAVVSCLGSWGTPKKNVLTSAMQTIIPAMVSAKISRIITLSGSGAATPAKPAGITHQLLLRALAPFPAGKVFADGEEHMRLLAESPLAWTTILAPIMNNFGNSGYQLKLTADNPLSTIKRQAVATAMLDQLDSTKYLRQATFISRQ